MKSTSSLNRETDHRALLNVEAARLDQVTVHHRVEVRVVGDVIDVTIKVVVHPAGLERLKVQKIGPHIGGRRLSLMPRSVRT